MLLAQPLICRAKVLVAGAHPDDPESSCGGTIAKLSQTGHEVVTFYLTKGERGISGKSLPEAAKIREAEVVEACQILGARPVFAGQIDGETEVTSAYYSRVRDLLSAEDPDIVFAHWPIDTHRDHRALSLLVYDAWLALHHTFALYYYEVMTGHQTQLFQPTDYVDITDTEPIKRASCLVHASQKPESFYAVHEQMSRFRGSEFSCEHAEAFIRHPLNA